MLCEPSRKIREIDNQKGVEFAKTVGRIIGKDIEVRWTFRLNGAFFTDMTPNMIDENWYRQT